MDKNTTELNSSNLSPALRDLVSTKKKNQATFASFLCSPEISDDLNNYFCAFSDRGVAVPENGEAFVNTTMVGCDTPVEEDWCIGDFTSKLREYADFLDSILANFRELKAPAVTQLTPETATPSGATLSLAERVHEILIERNNDFELRDAEHIKKCSEEKDNLTPTATIEDVLKCLSAAGVRDNFGLWNGYGESTMSVIVDEIMKEIVGADYDPWPGLNKNELAFLIDKRGGHRDCPFQLHWTLKSPDKPLTFGEKVLAVRHREWLEEGMEAKRKKLAKAQATVAELTGAV